MSQTSKFYLYPDHHLPIRKISNTARIFAIGEGDDRITVATWKEPDMEWGQHATWTSCKCGKDQQDEDGYCPHVHTALNQIMTGTFTFNDRATDEEA